MAKKRKEERIWGWLLFFIITLVFINPLFNLYIIFSSIEYSDFFITFESLSTTSLFILAGVFLWKKKSYAVKFTKVFLLTILVFNIIISLMIESNLIMTIIYPIIWLAYLTKSKKVKRMYSNLKEPVKGSQVWPKLAIIYAFILPFFGIIFSTIGLKNIYNNRRLKGQNMLITALIISILLTIVSFSYGFIIGFMSEINNVPASIDYACAEHCFYLNNLDYYFVEYSYGASAYVCYCYDEDFNYITQKMFFETN